MGTLVAWTKNMETARLKLLEKLNRLETKFFKVILMCLGQ